MFTSFKSRLAAYFVLLAVLPLGAAFWGFSSVARNAELERVDARLGAELRGALAAYSQRIHDAGQRARRLAAQPELHAALRARDRSRLKQLVRGESIRVEAPGMISVGPRPKSAVDARIHVRGAGLLGDLVAVVPLDDGARSRLSRSAGFLQGDRLALLPAADARRTTTVLVGGTRYRAVSSGSLPGSHSQLAALAPYAAIRTDSSAAVRRLLIALLGSLVGVALVAALEGRSILRSIREFGAAAQAIGSGRLEQRVPVRGGDEMARLARTFNRMADELRGRLDELTAERRRLQDSIARMGEALAATHDQDALLRVIAEAARDATSASGAIVMTESGAVAEVGEIADSADELEVQLAVNQVVLGTIALYGERFDEESAAAAHSFASHAAVALENADLHRIVELQAIEDALTGVPNRRRCEAVLELEVARAERYETELSVALCDLDRFKGINDRYGHAVGDLVLKEAAACIGHELRDLDLVGRWGGEEFVIVLPHTGSAGAVVTIERIREALSRRTVLTPDGTPVAVTASFGVAQVRPGMTAAALLEVADEALYAAKAAGRNRVSTGALSGASSVDPRGL
jgi:diguanylate cyclase (GGDEF)-like protein